MPIYEYKCRQHGHVFEVRQGFNDPAVELCEVCTGPADRLVSAAAFHLKGAGWYTSDYKSTPKPKDESKSDTASEKKEAACDSSGSCGTGACATNATGSKTSQ